MSEKEGEFDNSMEDDDGRKFGWGLLPLWDNEEFMGLW